MNRPRPCGREMSSAVPPARTSPGNDVVVGRAGSEPGMRVTLRELPARHRDPGSGGRCHTRRGGPIKIVGDGPRGRRPLHIDDVGGIVRRDGPETARAPGHRSRAEGDVQEKVSARRDFHLGVVRQIPLEVHRNRLRPRDNVLHVVESIRATDRAVITYRDDGTSEWPLRLGLAHGCPVPIRGHPRRWGHRMMCQGLPRSGQPAPRARASQEASAKEAM